MSANANDATERTALLLEQIRLPSEPVPATGPRRIGWKVVASIVAGAGAVGLLWQFGRIELARPAIPAPVALPRSQEAANLAAEANAVPAAGSATLDASGYVVALREATVSAKTTGRVAVVSIEEGQRVAAGDVLARLDDSNARAAVGQAQAQLDQATAGLAAATSALDDETAMFNRNDRQHAAQLISAQDYDRFRAAYHAVQADQVLKERMVSVAKANLEVALRTLDDTVVRAPFAGVVTVKAVQPGEIISPISAGGGFTRTGVGTIVDMDSLAVEVDVAENYINRVTPGQTVIVKLNAYPEWSIPGTVAAVIPTAERSKATVKVRISLATKDARVLPEMGARVSFMNTSTKE